MRASHGSRGRILRRFVKPISPLPRSAAGLPGWLLYLPNVVTSSVGAPSSGMPLPARLFSHRLPRQRLPSRDRPIIASVANSVAESNILIQIPMLMMPQRATIPTAILPWRGTVVATFCRRSIRVRVQGIWRRSRCSPIARRWPRCCHGRRDVRRQAASGVV
jgi:hypothetical protein